MKLTPREQLVVAVYATHSDAEDALAALWRAGHDMKRVSVLGRGLHDESHALGFYSLGERPRFWGGHGALWGSLWGMLADSAFFFIPPLGPVLVMGPLVRSVVRALECTPVDRTAAVPAAALLHLGVPSAQVARYELEVQRGRYLVLTRGSATAVEQASGVLGRTGAAELAAHPT